MTALPAPQAPSPPGAGREAPEPALSPFLDAPPAQVRPQVATPVSLVLAAALGVAAAVLMRVPLPVPAEEAPFRLGLVPLLLAVLLLGRVPAALASAVVLAGAAAVGPAQVFRDGIHVLEAWTAALLFGRLQSLPTAVALFWCTAGAALDALAFALGMAAAPEAPLLTFAAHLLSGLVSAFVAEGILWMLSPRLANGSARPRTRLRHYFFRWATWLVVAPGLVVAIVLAHITYREQAAKAVEESRRVLWQAAAEVSDEVGARGRTLEEIVTGNELAVAAEGLPGGRQLDEIRSSHSIFTALVLRDASGQVAAASPRFVASAPAPTGAQWRSRYVVGLARGGEAPSLDISVPLRAPDGRRAGWLSAAVDASFLSSVLARHRRHTGEVLAVRAEDGTVIASSGRRDAAGPDAATRHLMGEPVAGLPWSVVLDQPLADIQKGGRTWILRLLAAFLGMGALLHLATSLLARKVASPLAQMDRAAGALESGGVGGTTPLDDLAGSPIEEVHSLATRFVRMHEALAYHDALTGLPNEKLLVDRLSVAAAQAAEPPSSFTLLLVDLDRFRVIDSTLGHALGNEVLRKVGRRLQDCVRSGDTVARVGGDEFALLLPRVGRMEDATEIALKVMDAVKRPFLVAGQDVFVTASVGISLYPRDGLEPETLLKNAVAAAYAAKEQGQDSYRRYTARIKVRDAQRLLIETGLRRALENGGLFLHYQPIVDLRTGEMLSAEALVRWRREDVGVVDAADFIPVAEASGLITSIDLWVVRTACQQASAWREAGRDIRVAVNVSARQLQEPDIVDQVRHALERSALDPRLLEIEITEGVALRDVERSAEVLDEIRRLGVSISVDDFGTGYSSLSFLRRLPVDRVKLDRSFVQDITRSTDDAAIATAVIAMAHGLRLSVVAEGVETAEQLAFLRDHGCDAMQGRLFSPPVAPEALEALVDQGRRLTS